jgi:acylpyruvate hydrolase
VASLLLLGTPSGVGPVKAGDIIHAGLEVPGKGLLAELKVKVQNREGGFEFKEG